MLCSPCILPIISFKSFLYSSNIMELGISLWLCLNAGQDRPARCIRVHVPRLCNLLRFLGLQPIGTHQPISWKQQQLSSPMDGTRRWGCCKRPTAPGCTKTALDPHPWSSICWPSFPTWQKSVWNDVKVTCAWRKHSILSAYLSIIYW